MNVREKLRKVSKDLRELHWWLEDCAAAVGRQIRNAEARVNGDSKEREALSETLCAIEEAADALDLAMKEIEKALGQGS